MSAKKAFWRNDSGGAAVAKAVVSSNAHVVARNYEVKELRAGDIGLHSRLDLNGQSISELPDEQKRTAAAILEDMSESLLADLGKKRAGPLLSEGAVVYLLKRKAKEQDEEEEFYYGTVEAQTEQGVRLRILNLRSARAEIKFFPWDREFTEVPGYSGWKGLLKYLLLEVKSDSALDILGEDDEEILTEVIIAQPGHCSSFENHLDTETLIERLAEMKSPTNVSRVMTEAKNKDIRLAALKMLENQHAIVEFLLNSNNDDKQFAELVDKIDDQALIKKLICASGNYFVIRKAVEKFNGLADDFILDIESNYAQHCLIDADKVVDPANLRKVYDLTPDSSFNKMDLARKLHLEKDIIKKALEAENAESVKELIRALDLDMKTKIAIDAKSPDVAKEAMDQIAGYYEYYNGAEEHFTQIAYKSKHKEMRLEAAKRIHSEALDNVALNKNEEAETRLLALERMYGSYSSAEKPVTVLQQLESDETENPQIREAAKAKRIEIERKNREDKLCWHSDEMSQAELEDVLLHHHDKTNYLDRVIRNIKNIETLNKFVNDPNVRYEHRKNETRARIEELELERINASGDVEVLRQIIVERKASASVLEKAQAKLEALEKERIRKLVFSGGDGLKQSELAAFATDENEEIDLRVRAISRVDDKVMLRRWTSDHLFQIQTAAEARLLALGKDF